ncbi:jg3100 [Pararge aegeria aegeria]|uniref:Jg3100 protein n=1 Tax=Pararge aegeria aegeria TaxID=348720 RepID=A0A8S4QHW5_9NEOP|nr:jg3100 [Pararge aegeria aegeria]
MPMRENSYRLRKRSKPSCAKREKELQKTGSKKESVRERRILYSSKCEGKQFAGPIWRALGLRYPSVWTVSGSYQEHRHRSVAARSGTAAAPATSSSVCEYTRRGNAQSGNIVLLEWRS